MQNLLGCSGDAIEMRQGELGWLILSQETGFSNVFYVPDLLCRFFVLKKELFKQNNTLTVFFTAILICEYDMCLNKGEFGGKRRFV